MSPPQVNFVQIDVPHAHLQRLPAVGNRPLLFICNRAMDGWDERVMYQLLAGTYPDLKIISVSEEGEKMGKWDDILFKKNLSSAKKALKKEVAQEGKKTVLGLPIRFNPLQAPNPLFHQNLNMFFKMVRAQGFTVVLLHLDYPNKGMAEYDLLWQGFNKAFGFKAKHQLSAGQLPEVRVRIGLPIPSTELQPFDKSYQVRRFLQSRLFAMANQDSIEPWHNFFKRWIPKVKGGLIEPIIEPTENALIELEIDQIRPNYRLLEQSGMEVFVVAAASIPNLLREIGRQRELTFRSADEGTGLAIDLDEFDLYYLQLIIWDKEAKRLVGGYRIGCGDQIMQSYGRIGFYCSTLFRIKRGFWPILHQSVELGRSYIVADYQRKPLPLFLLWKGILHFLLAHPQYRYLFGPVSISRQFSDISRGLMVGFLQKHYFDHELAEHLSPRKPFKINPKNVDMDLLIKTFGGDLSNLDKFIVANERTPIKIPVLLRQYIRQNARFVAFNIDPKFSDCLDGFMLLNLQNLPESTVENLQRERNP